MAQVAVVVACLLVAAGAEPPSQYGPPTQGLSGQYGVPGRFEATGSQQGRGGYSSGISSAGGYSSSGNEDENSEPANYEFQYDVEAPEYRLKFGHHEERQGEVAQGKYYVLLPDGRTQLVEYVADQDGYRPKITYVEEGQGGYSSGSPNADRGQSSEGGGTNNPYAPQGGYSNGNHGQGGYTNGSPDSFNSGGQGGYNR